MRPTPALAHSSPTISSRVRPSHERKLGPFSNRYVVECPHTSSVPPSRLSLRMHTFETTPRKTAVSSPLACTSMRLPSHSVPSVNPSTYLLPTVSGSSVSSKLWWSPTGWCRFSDLNPCSRLSSMLTTISFQMKPAMSRLFFRLVRMRKGRWALARKGSA